MRIIYIGGVVLDIFRSKSWSLTAFLFFWVATVAVAHDDHAEDSLYYVYYTTPALAEHQPDDNYASAQSHGKSLEEICEKVRLYRDTYPGDATVTNKIGGAYKDANGTVTELSYRCVRCP